MPGIPLFHRIESDTLFVLTCDLVVFCNLVFLDKNKGGIFLNFFGAWGGDSYQEFWDGEDESMSDAD